ncbi:DNA-binding protein SMUBP-2-like [Anneissia japonica]|uniref:DNA-binding protein SMUBP-2-like n=1 Tax=Anneissia japonica TaxID=1529436 RepID=UPI001425BA71|nr:DNA-binding protein SMUBP-2-like [Anneissia japonica]
MAVEAFVKKQLELINLERQEEIEETRVFQENLPLKELQQRGVCLLKLHITSQYTGLYGRKLVVFEGPQTNTNGSLPAHSFSPGVIVGVSSSNGDNSGSNQLSGIVSRVTDKLITVAFDSGEDLLSLDDSGVYRLNKLSDDVTFRRIKKALAALESHQPGPASHLIDVLFGEVTPSSNPTPPPIKSGDAEAADRQGTELRFINEKLDESQQEAVRFSLCQREVAVIHGPPGTGKTTTIIEVIQQAVQRKMKVLACAPSNVAVDNLVERLAQSKVKIIRLGHPARAHRGIQKYSLDAILSVSEATKIVQDVRRDIDKTQASMAKSKDKEERRKLRTESKHLRQELKQREAKAMREILTHADVVLATTTSASREGPLYNVPKEHFDLVVVDECAQALEASCWIPLHNAAKCILAGDHQQLPATIKSNKAAKEGLAISLMERVLDLHGDSVMRMLSVQYRMNDDIMRWPSEQLYDGKLLSHESVSDHLLKDLAHVAETEDTCIPLLLVDTAGCDMHELDLPDEISRGNEGEADLVAAHIERLLSSGLRSSEIAVISPYNLQVDLVRLRISAKYPDLEIKSVDGFQGREKEAVIISLVRSNTKGEVGFLAENRRINVAITRARRHLAVFCDSETVSHHEFLKSLVNYINSNGEVRSVFHYQNEMNQWDDVPRPDYIDFSGLQKVSAVKKVKPTTGSRCQNPRPKQSQKKGNTQKGEGRGKSATKNTASIREQSSVAKGGMQCLTEKEIQTQVEEFLNDNSRMAMAFSTNLNSKERFLVHEIAERLGLIHVSTGEDNMRHISISKKQTKEKAAHPSNDTQSMPMKMKSKKNKKHSSSPEMAAKEEVEGMTPEGAAAVEDNIEKVDASSIRNCQYCKKEVNLGNLLLHELQCEKMHIKKLKDNDKSVTKKKAKQNQKKVIEKVDGDDFEALIAAAVKGDNTCNFVKCKEKIALIGQLCIFCNRRYCLSHHMPEIHGCGDKAHARARNQLQREKVFRNGSGTKEKKIDPARKANLQRKLDAKTTEMEALRKRKDHKK